MTDHADPSVKPWRLPVGPRDPRETHRAAILAEIRGVTEDTFLGEPTGRDTLNAVGLGAAVIARRDPDAVMAVFTADHVIEPVDRFAAIVREGYALAEAHANALITFGIAPTHAATGYGYLELGDALASGMARQVRRFKEKPETATAAVYYAAGAQRYQRAAHRHTAPDGYRNAAALSHRQQRSRALSARGPRRAAGAGVAACGDGADLASRAHHPGG